MTAQDFPKLLLEELHKDQAALELLGANSFTACSKGTVWPNGLIFFVKTELFVGSVQIFLVDKTATKVNIFLDSTGGDDLRKKKKIKLLDIKLDNLMPQLTKLLTK